MKLGSWAPDDADQKGLSIIRFAEGGVVTPEQPIDIFDPFDTGLGDILRAPWQAQISHASALTARNSIVFGQRFLEANDFLFSDYELNERLVQAIIDEKSGIRTHEHGIFRTDDGFGSSLLDKEPVQLSGKVAFITCSEPMNYGAWLIRTLPKVEIAKRHAGSDDLRFLGYCDRPWQENLLRLMGLRDDQIVRQRFDQTYFVEDVLLPNWPNRSKFIEDESRNLFEKLRQDALAGRPGWDSPQYLYVSRHTWSARSAAAGKYRPFRQEEEFISRLEKLGVTPYSPENFPIEEVIATFANAKLVIGPQGAGMFNTVFCRPGTSVIDIEHLPTFLRSHSNIYASMQLRYRIICGAVDEEVDSHPSQKGLRIDMEAVVSYIEKVMRGLST